MEILANEAVEVKISSNTQSEAFVFDSGIKHQSTNSFRSSKETLDELIADRKKWESGSLRTSNKELYAILQKVKAFCGGLPSAQAKERSLSLEKFYKERGWRYNKEAPLESRAIRVIFGDENRRRVSGYSIVLREAKKQGVSIMDLPEWIELKGGIQEIRLSQSKSYVSPSDKIDEMKTRLESRQSFIGKAKDDGLSLLADGEFMNSDCVLAARQLSDGSFGIYAILRSDAIMNAAYLAMYSKGKKAYEAAKKEVEAANDAGGTPVAA